MARNKENFNDKLGKWLAFGNELDAFKTRDLTKEEIVSATDLVKNFANIRKKTKEGSNMIVFKNNKPDLAILDIDEYASLLRAAELLEDITIMKMVEERDKQDDGTRYTSEDVIRMRKELKEKQRLAHA